MIKTYQGFALPSRRQVAYSVVYLCPRCASQDVEVDATIKSPAFCDGGPSTADEIATWQCQACGHRGNGNEFAVRLIEAQEPGERE